MATRQTSTRRRRLIDAGGGIRWIPIGVAAVVATVLLSAWISWPKALTIEMSTSVEEGKRPDLSVKRIGELIGQFAALPSRVTGYGGDRAALEIVREQLRQMGIDQVQVQEFPVAVPITASARLVAPSGGGGVTIPLHPLWPNLARTSQTPPDGLTGPVVYVGAGDDDDLAGKQIAGAILVIDWDCDRQWLSAGEFGAKAVIFRATGRASGYTARNKFLTVPANLPRFYVREEDLPALDALADRQARATVHCRTAWREATAANVLAEVSPGDPSADPSDSDQTPIIFHAYYDSISVVPSLRPGAEQACGAATALELARFLRDMAQPPRRPVYLLLTGGHGQGLSGMTHFVSQLRQGLADGWSDDQADSLLARMGRPGLFVGLDLSSRSERMGVFCAGSFRGQSINRLRPKYSVLGQKLNAFAAQFRSESDHDGPGNFVDCINLTLGRGWWTYFPYPAPFESELPTMAGFPAITLATINDDRRYMDTPQDTPQRMRLDMLKRQLLYRPGRRAGLANLALALSAWRGPFVSSGLADQWASVAGRVVWLDQRTDYTPNKPLVRAVVFLKTGRGEKFLMGTRGGGVAMTGAGGSFRFDGLIKAAANWQFNNCLVEAYGPATEEFITANPDARGEYLKVLQRAGRNDGRIERNGDIIFAVDMARAKEYPWQVKVLRDEQHVNLVCFPCTSISLFALTDPREYIDLSDLQILDAATQSPPFQFGRSSTDMPAGRSEANCVSLWADPTLRVRLTFGFGFQKRRLLLTRATPGNHEGEGFAMEELGTIPSMVLQGAGDMWILDQFRIDRLDLHGISNPRVRKIHAESKRHLDRARAALAKRDYRTYRAASETGWAMEGRAYGELLSTTNNMIRGVLFYLAVLIPCSYCLERLLLAGGTIRRRIIGMVVIFSICFVVLALAHPAFRFTLTPMIVLLAFVILSLAAAVSVLLVGRFDRMLQQRKAEETGLHQEIRNVGRVAVHALDLGISNIRRRPKRGFLTAMTIVLVTFTLLSFTSLVPELNISRLHHASGNPDAYRGLMIRSRNWAPLPGPLYESILRHYPRDVKGGSAVAGRAWFFSDYSGRLSQIDLSVSRKPGDDDAPTRNFTAVALLCMEHTEPAATGIDKALLPGGRWFNGEDDLGVILPAHVARSLGLGPEDVGAHILLFGRELPLLGLIDSGKMDAIRDIDGEPITPVNFVLQEQMQAESQTDKEIADTLEEYVHYGSHELAIIPLKYGLQLGASYRSIAVRTAPDTPPKDHAETFARRSNATILANDGQDVTLYASVDSARLGVAGQIVVPVILGFVMVLGTMLGSVYERRREIFVYNSVGLSPINVSSLFLAESGVYAILGASMGYLLGQVVAKVLLATGTLSGLNLNYSAGSAVFVTVLTMLIVLVSTLYPARQAFLAAVPETHRDDDMGQGDGQTDQLAMYMPFVATPSSVLGMQAYMYEFLENLQGVTVGQLALDDLHVRLDRPGDRDEPVLVFRAWLAPFDLGVSHDVELRIAFRQDRRVYQYHLAAARRSGDRQNWRRLTPRFLLTIRKQLLMWRILSDEEVARYAAAGEALFGAETNLTGVDGDG